MLDPLLSGPSGSRVFCPGEVRRREVEEGELEKKAGEKKRLLQAPFWGGGGPLGVWRLLRPRSIGSVAPSAGALGEPVHWECGAFCGRLRGRRFSL